MTKSPIEYTPGMLMVTLPTGEDVFIHELPMSAYESFYKHWLMAVSILKNDESLQDVKFTTAYCTSQAFRENIIEALRILGFEEPEVLTPKLIQLLLICREPGTTKPGYAFLLHEEEPDMPKKPPERMPQTPKKTKQPGFLKRLQNSISATTLQFTSLVNQTLYGSGLCVAY